MRRFLIDSSWTAVSAALLAGLVLFAWTLPAAPAETPEALGISEHTAACNVCRLPRYGSDGEPSMLGPEPWWAMSTPRRACGVVEEPLLICRAGRPADVEPRDRPTGRVRQDTRVCSSGGI